MNNSSTSQGQKLDSNQLEKKRKQLFKFAMQDKWEEVIKIYEKYPQVQGEKLTRAKGTTLHVAISAGKEDVALRLLELSKENVERILKTKNDTESTPLHVAASHGLHRACWNMAKCCPTLVTTERNRRGETPLFTAARHGKEEAFFALERSVQEVNPLPKDMSERDVTHCRREKDGNNILHFAILGEYLGLANEIIELYPQLVHYVNTSGESPLHYLAKKPLCFRSGTYLGLFDQLIYSCIFIGQHKRKVLEYKNQESYLPKKSNTQLLPETFDTFSDVFTLLKPLHQIAIKMPGWIRIPKWISIPKWIRSKREKGDEGNSAGKEPINKSTCTPHEGDPESSQVKEKGKMEEDNEHPFRRFPAIYAMGVAFFKVVMKFILVIMGIVTRMHEWIRVPKWNRRRREKGDEENPAVAKASTNKSTTPREGDQESSREPIPVDLLNVPIGVHPAEIEPNQEFPEIYNVGVALFTAVTKVILVIMGIGLRRTHRIERMKRNNRYAVQLMNKLIENCNDWEYDKDGMNPHTDNKHSPTKDVTATAKESPDGKSKGECSHQVNVDTICKCKCKCKDEQKGEESKKPVKVTPMLEAAKNGIIEIVKKILEAFPVAVLDVDEDGKNIVLLAAENRQSYIYKHMLNREIMKDSAFGKIDKNGNSALHLAAELSEKLPWNIPGVALQMQWEIKWYKYVMQSMEGVISHTYNDKGKTAQEVFIKNHEDLVKEAGNWLVKTSESCSVVAALIAGVAFASAATVPGGLNQSSGEPILSGETTFQVFAFSSLVALCFSVTSLVMFLTILTSRYQEKDFNKSLPTKLIVGLTSLFTSIAAMLVSFCAGDFFVVQKKLKFVAFPIYAVMLFPVSFFAIANFPLYVDLISATIADVPVRTQRMHTL